MSNNMDVSLAIHLKLREEIERLQFQIKTEREAHGRVRQEARDLKEQVAFLRSEAVEESERHASEMRQLIVKHNDGVLALDSAVDCAAKSTGLVVGMGALVAVTAALDAAHLLSAPGVVLGVAVGVLVAIVTHGAVSRSLWAGVE